MRPIDPRTEERLRQATDPATCRHLARLTGPRSRCLEIGCGPGQYRRCVRGEYIGVDVTADDYAVGLPRTPDALADASRLPFRAGVFDFVLFSNIFHFLPDPERTLAEALRVLEQGGTLAIFDYSRTTVQRLAGYCAAYDPPLAARPWTCDEWARFVRDAGLADVMLWRKTPVLPAWTAHVAALPLVRNLYRVLVDGREGGVVVVGRKVA